VPLLIVAVALLGLAIGSFLNVVIYRVPAGVSLVRPPSRCSSCEHPIRNRHNVPVLSWLVLSGRCADCHAPISGRYPVIEALSAALFIAVTVQVAHLHLLAALPAYLYFTAIGLCLTAIDIDVRRLPNVIVLPSYPVLAALLTIAAIIQGDPAALLRAGIGAVGLFAFYFAVAYSYPAGMGFGDVKLAGIVGGVLGFLSYPALAVGAFAAFLIGAVVGLLTIAARRGTRKSALPFGPFMILGALLALFFSAPIAEFYSRMVLRT
jgi:leader peptidase (prepilin peptidase) / N-methyltransferase